MTPSPQRTEPLPRTTEATQPLELTNEQIVSEPSFDPGQWSQSEPEERGTGGRKVLAIALSMLAVAWIAYTAWAAGRSLAGQPISSPQIAQWIAVVAGPLALFGLAWLAFGRTRRKEAERFTRSVIAMRHEAQSLEALLEVLSQRIVDSRSDLAATAKNLMHLGDEATGRLSGITREFDSSSALLKEHGDALDKAALAARNDIAVILEDLPRAELSTRQIAEQFRDIGSESGSRTVELGQQVADLAQRTREADRLIGEAVDRLATRLSEVEVAGATAAARVGDADVSFQGTLNSLLDRTSASLEEIRSGIDAQAAAVAALVGQASAGIGKAGADAAESLAANVDHANSSLELLSARVAEQDRASQRMIAEIDRGLSLIDERFSELAAQGDVRASRFLESLTRARTELDSLATQAGAQDGALESLAERTAALRESIDCLTGDIREGTGAAIGEAQGSADRLAQTAGAMRAEIGWIRDTTVDADDKLASTGARIEDHRQQVEALLQSVDQGVGGAQSSIAELASVIAQVQREAASLSAETGPALIAALVQVKDAAAHAAQRAREAIEAVIPQAAGKLSEETKHALERVIRESIEERLREVDSVAARAVDSARAASDRLTQQVLNLGQSAAALEAHIEQTGKDQREKESEAFARRVGLLIDSMNSAAIDVGKILSDEIDDKAWSAYLKGNRGVFTSRAARLIGGSETRAIRAHYESDIEFQRSVNRFVHDFEEMLRRVLAERDGGMIAVTLMSSDMGKLYAALAQAIEKRR